MQNEFENAAELEEALKAPYSDPLFALVEQNRLSFFVAEYIRLCQEEFPAALEELHDTIESLAGAPLSLDIYEEFLTCMEYDYNELFNRHDKLELKILQGQKQGETLSHSLLMLSVLRAAMAEKIEDFQYAVAWGDVPHFEE